MAAALTSMHYCMLFTFNKDKAENSLEARMHADDYLASEGFCTETRWAYGIADWYVIGGRWSRLLTDTTPRGKGIPRVAGRPNPNPAGTRLHLIHESLTIKPPNAPVISRRTAAKVKP
jgi:hypothetical protein